MVINKKVLFSLLIIAVLVIAGCSQTTSNATDIKAQSTAPATNPIKPVSLIQQVKNTGHYKFFAAYVAKGPEGTKQEHYSDSCISCHSAVKMLDDKNAKLADFFPGGKYAGQDEGITCRVCHTFGGKELVSLKIKGWDSCASCHTSGSPPTLGKEVHHPQNEMIRGIGVGEVPDTPSYKYSVMKDSFACYDCHVTNSQKHDFNVPGVTISHDASGLVRTDTKLDYDKFAEVFKQDKCVNCHADPKPTLDKLKEHQADIEKRLSELKPIYEDWSKKVSTMDQNDPKVKTFREGATYYTYVEADSSKGAHNYALAKALLEKAQAKFSQLK